MTFDLFDKEIKRLVFTQLKNLFTISHSPLGRAAYGNWSPSRQVDSTKSSSKALLILDVIVFEGDNRCT